MTLIDILRNDLAQVGTIWTSAGLSTLSTNDALQRLMWTLAIVVSVFAIVRYIYRFYTWVMKDEPKYTDDEE